MKFYVITKPNKGVLRRNKKYASHIENGLKNAKKSAMYFMRKGVRTWIGTISEVRKSFPLTDNKLTKINGKYWR